MIRFVNLVIFIGMLTGGQAQGPGEPFYVVGLKGKVIDKHNKRVLAYGDKVYSLDTLQAQSKDYYVGLINSYGMYELNPEAGKPNGNGWSEFALSVVNSVRQIEYKNADVRGGIDQAADIARWFHPGDTVAENRILLLDYEQVRINGKDYPAGKNNFFCWSLAGTTDKMTPIRARGDTLLLRKPDFQDVNGAPGVSYDLYFQHNDADGIIHLTRITDFGIVFLSPSEASAMIDHFLQGYPAAAGSDEKDLVGQLMALFTRYYQAAPRGMLLDGLMKKKVKEYLKK